MAVIGIYKDIQNGSQNAEFEISALHFNLWVLPLAFSLGNFWKSVGYICIKRMLVRQYIDIGLRLSVKSGLLSDIDLHLPCEPILEAGWSDLQVEILNEKVNDLLFGTKVNSNNGKLEYKRNDKDISDTVFGIKSIKKVSENSAERHRVSLSSTVDANGGTASVYIRFRYECQDSSDMLISKGWGFAKRGYIADLRLNDIRETVDFDLINQSMEMKQVNEFNAFLICPSNYIMMMESPRFHYSRLIESNAWNFYLEKCKPFSRRHKLTIHQWKVNDVTYESPFRAFAHLHKEFGFVLLVIYALGIVSPIIFNYLSGFFG